MAQVEIKKISKHFGNVKAVDQIDLATAEGEFLVLLGPSGCGKTTLLRMIAGIEEPTSGDIIIGGQVVTNAPPRARKREIAAYLPANGAFLSAIALMVAGWDGCNEPYPGIPKDGAWTVRAEGLHPLP